MDRQTAFNVKTKSLLIRFGYLKENTCTHEWTELKNSAKKTPASHCYLFCVSIQFLIINRIRPWPLQPCTISENVKRTRLNSTLMTTTIQNSSRFFFVFFWFCFVRLSKHVQASILKNSVGAALEVGQANLQDKTDIWGKTRQDKRTASPNANHRTHP